MKRPKSISFSTSGNRADIGPLEIYRILPNRYANAVGHFVFLDHLAPQRHEHNFNGSTGPHPHRGIATLTYVLSGEGRHSDSAGHHATVNSGGVQWMKAGRGIIHDETLSADKEDPAGLSHGFQFWINLPSAVKKEAPQYMALKSQEVPVMELPEDAGIVKIILGSYENLRSPIPTYASIFLYHLKLNKSQSATFTFPYSEEVAAFLPTQNIVINGKMCLSGEFIEFDREEGSIQFQNSEEAEADVLIFGGEPYVEPIFADGPFVMNSKAEIAEAYRDYFAGNYGEIKRD